MRALSHFPRVILQAAEAREPHRIAFFAHDLATLFHAHWNRGKESPHLRFVNEKSLRLTEARIALASAVALVLRSALGILGVSAPGECDRRAGYSVRIRRRRARNQGGERCLTIEESAIRARSMMNGSKGRTVPEINLEEFERRLRAAGTQQGAVEDPLEELTRLVNTIASDRPRGGERVVDIAATRSATLEAPRTAPEETESVDAPLGVVTPPPAPPVPTISPPRTPVASFAPPPPLTITLPRVPVAPIAPPAAPEPAPEAEAIETADLRPSFEEAFEKILAEPDESEEEVEAEENAEPPYGDEPVITVPEGRPRFWRLKVGGLVAVALVLVAGAVAMKVGVTGGPKAAAAHHGRRRPQQGGSAERGGGAITRRLRSVADKRIRRRPRRSRLSPTKSSRLILPRARRQPTRPLRPTHQARSPRPSIPRLLRQATDSRTRRRSRPPRRLPQRRRLRRSARESGSKPSPCGQTALWWQPTRSPRRPQFQPLRRRRPALPRRRSPLRPSPPPRRLRPLRSRIPRRVPARAPPRR